MGERKEGHRTRDLLLAGAAGATVGVASVLTWHVWDRQRSGKEREYVPTTWDPSLDPEAVAAEVAAAQKAAVDPLRGRRYKNWLAVVSTDADGPGEVLEASAAARAAVAVQTGEGEWRIGVMEGDDYFGEMPSSADRIGMAVHLGQPAIRSVVLATVDQGVFRAWPSITETISDISGVLEGYPDVPILSSIPSQK